MMRSVCTIAARDSSGTGMNIMWGLMLHAEQENQMIALYGKPNAHWDQDGE